MAEKIGAEVLLVVKKLSRRINHEVMKLRRMEDLWTACRMHKITPPQLKN